MFDIIDFTLASNVADNGTVTVGYPTGRTKGDYSLTSADHVLFVGQNQYAAPPDFTLTFNANASNITLTNKSGGTWAQGTPCKLQAERAGADAGLPLTLDQDIVDNGRVTPVMPVLLNLGSPGTAVTNGISASQSVASGVAALINGSLASGGVVTFDVPRNAVGAWTNTAILTLTGKDEYGNVIVEKSASGTSHTGKKAFKTITGATFNANVTSATLGTGEVLGLPVALRKSAQVLGELKDGQIIGRASGVSRINWNADQVSVLAGTVSAIELISPIAGNISKLAVAVRAAVGTGGAVSVAVGTTTVVGLSVTVADSATKGTTATDTPTGDGTEAVVKGSRIQIIFADAFATSGALDGYLEITPTDDLSNGTLVVADGTEATATTGDVRGTYLPADVADGTTGRKLLVVLPDPNDLGVAQFAG